MSYMVGSYLYALFENYLKNVFNTSIFLAEGMKKRIKKIKRRRAKEKGSLSVHYWFNMYAKEKM